MSRVERDLALVLVADAVTAPHRVAEGLLSLAFNEQDRESASSAAARRLLERAAPQLLAFSGALTALHGTIGDNLDMRSFDALELDLQRRTSAPVLADEMGVSSSRIGQRRDRAAKVLRRHVADAPPPSGWLVGHVRSLLGAAAPFSAVIELIEQLGLPTPGLTATAVVGDLDEATSLLLWLAGPYRISTQLPGWIVRRDTDLPTLLRELLAADGWVRPEVELASALHARGVRRGLVRPLLGACGVAVIADACAWVSGGALPDAIERLFEASGRALTPGTCQEILREAGRKVTDDEVARALRGNRFRAVGGGRFELASWPEAEASEQRRQRRDRARVTAPAGAVTPTLAQLSLYGSPGTAMEDLAGAVWQLDGQQRHGGGEPDERLWFVVEVDQSVLSGAPSAAPEAVVRALGVGFQQRRTYASRYGPVTISNDGSEPLHSSLRPLAFGTGASVGDRLKLGFGTRGDLVVEMHEAELGAEGHG